VPAERSVLGLGQLQPRLQANRRRRHADGAEAVSGGVVIAASMDPVIIR
jgi:hypothetical protein